MSSIMALRTIMVFCMYAVGVMGDEIFDRDNIFVKTLEKCHSNSVSFDPCIKKAANLLRPQYKVGIPELKIPPFDPFFIKEVSTSRGGPNINMRLTLRNVYEKGWTRSKMTGFRSNLNDGSLIYHQFFPEKFLYGEYDIVTNVVSPIQNEGKFKLSLFNYTQVTSVNWTRPGERIKVHVRALDSGDMKLHLTNLIGGRVILEGMLDRIINAAWRPGFNMLKPVIDDLVSSAFTKLFNDALIHVPFQEIIPK